MISSASRKLLKQHLLRAFSSTVLLLQLSIIGPYTITLVQANSVARYDTPMNNIQTSVLIHRGGESIHDDNGEEEEAASEDNKLPTLFQLPEEEQYDRYAACLAATEGLRKIRDREMSKTKKGGIISFFSRKEVDEEETERANSKYVLNSSMVIKSLGLTVPQFNQLGREIMGDEVLKEKVTEQAYLYRLSAGLSLPDNRVPIISDPTSSPFLNAHRRHRIQMFARSITEIEHLRTDQMEKLMKALKIPALPEGVNLSDPNVVPFLSPKVRAVCEAFPFQAEEIVRKYGLNSDEFNDMLEKTKKDPVFRWRVKHEIGTEAKK